MMVKGLGMMTSSPTVSQRALFRARAPLSSSIAPLEGRTLFRKSPPPGFIVVMGMRFSTLSTERVTKAEFGRPTLSSIEVWNGVICSATYGSTNGNGRPGGGAEKSGDGYNSRFLTEDPESSEGQSPYGQQDLGIGRISEVFAKRKGKPSGLRHEENPQRDLSEKQGEDPYRLLENGQKVYLDELDVITLLEPPPFLRPLPSVFYNHAAFLWKKIGDIPEERRHRLLDLLLPRHITKMWELSKLRYEDPGAFSETAADMLHRTDASDRVKPSVWDGRVIQVPWYLKMFSRFQKVFFIGNDNKTYGRVITGGKFLSPLSNRLAPLYFEVIQADSVMATDEPCDLMLEYGDGHLHLRDNVPPGFAKPGRHLPPFNDKACDYLRAVGPGVMVGQGWVERRKLEQCPRPLFGEFIMVQKFQ
ncbi:unnamed protein product [Calypogeia fissa]